MGLHKPKYCINLVVVEGVCAVTVTLLLITVSVIIISTGHCNNETVGKDSTLLHFDLVETQIDGTSKQQI